MEFEKIEYHCPDCQSITPVRVGACACIGCGRAIDVYLVNPAKRQTASSYEIIRIAGLLPPEDETAQDRQTPIGHIQACATARDASLYLWGRDVRGYLIRKNGQWLAPFSSGNLSEIERLLEASQ